MQFDIIFVMKIFFWICPHSFSNLFLFKLNINILCYMITNPFILNSTFDQNSSFLSHIFASNCNSNAFYFGYCKQVELDEIKTSTCLRKSKKKSVHLNCGNAKYVPYARHHKPLLNISQT